VLIVNGQQQFAKKTHFQGWLVMIAIKTS